MPAFRVCSSPGCPNLHAGPGRCPACRADADKQRRPDGNPYNTKAHRLGFRANVLAKHPHCMCTGECGTKHNGICAQPSTIANHFPHERRDLVDAGLDPNDPQYGRGECKTCHDRYTARHTPGGWNQRD